MRRGETARNEAPILYAHRRAPPGSWTRRDPHSRAAVRAEQVIPEKLRAAHGALRALPNERSTRCALIGLPQGRHRRSAIRAEPRDPVQLPATRATLCHHLPSRLFQSRHDAPGLGARRAAVGAYPACWETAAHMAAITANSKMVRRTMITVPMRPKMIPARHRPLGRPSRVALA